MRAKRKPAGGATPQAGFDAATQAHHSPIKETAKAHAIATMRALPDIISGVLVLALFADLLEVMI